MRKSFTRLSSILVLLLLSVQMGFAQGPTLATDGLDPADGDLVASSQSVFTMTFNQDVVPGNGGAIGFYKSDDTPLRVFQVGSTSASGTATFDGNTVTIEFFSLSLTEGETYYVTVEGQAVKDADGNNFAGIDANDWEVTITDTQAPTVESLDPEDGEIDVPVNYVFTVEFSEPVMYVAGYTPALGDFAVYTATSAADGEEGGDLVTLGLPTLTGNGTDTWTITWPNNLPENTDLYVRIKPGILEDASGNDFAGINDNDTWTFTTKDADFIEPTITATPDPLWTNSTFDIDFDDAEVLTLSATGVEVADGADLKAYVSLTADGVAVTIDDAIFTKATNTITITAKDPLAGDEFTVSIGEAVFEDAAGNLSAAASETFDAGDWIAPTIESLTTTNYGGTTFDILVEADEPCVVKYIVVRPTTYEPIMEDVIGYTEDDDNDTKLNSTSVNRRHRVAVGSPAGALGFGYEVKDGTTWKTVEIFAEGFITVNDPSLEILERVDSLPATHGQDYVVYAVAYDASTEGVYVPDYSGHTTNPAIVGNISDMFGGFDAMTVDILMPTVWFDADSVGLGGLKVNVDEENGAGTDPMGIVAKNANVYIHFNEDIRMADGTAIDEDDIPLFVTLTDTVLSEDIGFTATYSADADMITIVPDSSFKSETGFTVTIDPTEIEDVAGNEFQPANADLRDQGFTVEEYFPMLSLFEPEDGETGYKGNCITVEFNDIIYVPRDEEPVPGELMQVSNDPVSPYFVGRYFDITEGDETGATDTDAPIKDDFDFEVTFANGMTTVNICRTSGSWDSEIWYYVEAEGELLDGNRYSLAQGAGVSGTDRTPDDFLPVTTASNNNQTISFQYGDVRSPELTFFLPSQSDLVNYTYFEDINGHNDVPVGDSIGVLVDEWVQLGFADEIMIDAPTPGSIVNPVVGNSFRRYFKLESGGEEISFDVVSVDILNDSLIFYIDPYYPDGNGYEEDDNFDNGVCYEVTYISTQLEANDGESYMDDNENKVYDEIVASFCGEATSPSASVNATIVPWGTNVSASTSEIEICFDQILNPATIGAVPDITIQDITTPGTVTTLTGLTNASYTCVTYAVTLSENVEYEVVIGDQAFGFNTTPAVTWPNIGSDSIYTFTTVDSSAPLAMEFIPADDSVGVGIDTDLTIIFDEDVVPVTGKKLYIWETGVSEIARVDAANVDLTAGDTLIVDNSWFEGKLEYDKNYHVIIQSGFVTDAVGNPFAGITNPATWNWTTMSDPAPSFASFSPKGEVDDPSKLTQDLVFTFSEPVRPVANMEIVLWDVTDGMAVQQYDVDTEVNPSSGYNTTYSLDVDIVGLQWGHTYRVNIEAGAYEDMDGNLTYICDRTLGGTTTLGDISGTPAEWVFTFADTQGPDITFWPEDTEEHIPYNAYLYIQFDEPIALDNGSAIITDPSVIATNIPSFVTLTAGGSINKLVEFVDNDKRTLRITPLDPAGHNYTGDNNATMQTETSYNLAIAQSFGGLTIVDTAGNAIGSESVTFLTEDITDPVISAVGTSAVDENSAKVEFTLSEEGTAWVYVVAGTPSSAPSAADIMANAQWSDDELVGAVVTDDIVVGETVGANTFTAYIYAEDDEIDEYANPDPDMWIFTSTGDGVDRIRDILPAPNSSAVASTSFVVCDDDDPVVEFTNPVHMQEWVQLDDSIFIVFNEDIAFGMGNPNAITLRKAMNNAEVELDEAPFIMDGDTIVLNPVTLEEETWYYVEIDRYAVMDTSGCSTNYLDEEVGKEFLMFQTLDNTPPTLDTVTPGMNVTCVPTTTDEVRVYFNETNDLKKLGDASDNIYIYHGTNSSTGVLADIIPFTDPSVTLEEDDRGQYLSIDIDSYILIPDQDITVLIPGGLIGDEYNNAYAANIEWTFKTIDNIPPVVSWTLFEMQSYFNNSASTEVGINSYWSEYANGDAGETVSEAPTHVALKIEFDEEIMVRTKAGGSNETWVGNIGSAWDPAAASSYTNSTTDGVLSNGEIFSVLNVADLEYNDDSLKSQLWVYDVTNTSITIGFDTLTAPLFVEAMLDAATTELDEQYYGSLLSLNTYPVTLVAGAISDPLECTDDRIVNTETDVVTIETRDDTPPMLDISACADGACITKDGPITLTFDKPVVKSSYDIVWVDHESNSADNLILNEMDLEYTGAGRYLELIRVSTGDSVEVSVDVVDMQTIVITPLEDLASDENYTIAFNKWTVKEYIENNPGGTLFEGEDCTFLVADYLAPMVVSLTPADDVVNPVDTLISSDIDEIVVQFDEKIMKGTDMSMEVEIRRENGQIFEKVSLADVSIDAATKTKLTIPFQTHDMLEDFTMYYVVMPEGFVTDTVACAPNAFGGFDAALDASTGELVAADWNFKTSDGTPPELTVDVDGNLNGLWPAPGADDVAKNTDLLLYFDEPIEIDGSVNDAGLVIYWDNGDDTEVDFGNAIEFIPWSELGGKITIEDSDIYNQMLNDIVRVNPDTEFDRLGTYYIRVSGDDVTDIAGNAWSDSENTLVNEVKDEEWKFVITNDVSPVLVETSPDYDGVAAPGVYELLPATDEGYAIADLSMTFEDGEGNPLNVAKGDASRKVRIYEYVYNPVTKDYYEKLWLQLPITDESIVVNGNVVTLTDVVLRDGIKGDSVYYVTVDPGAITNGFPGSMTYWSGISNGFRWRFQTAADDVFVAGYDIISPNVVEDADDARNLTIEAASTLQIGFNEGVEALTAPTGMVKVYDADADSLVEAVTVVDSMCVDTVLTVTLSKLYDETNFYVVVEAGALGDTSTVSTPNAEVGGLDVWSFHTGDNTAPVPVAVSPADADVCVGADVTITLTFDETNGVVANDGTITVTDTAGTVIAEATAADLMVDGNTVMVDFVGLPDTTMLTVTASEGLLLDGDTHSPLESPEYSWSFTTGENTAPTVADLTPVEAITADTVLSITFSEMVNAATLEGIVTVNGEEVVVTSTDGMTYTAALTELMSETTYEVVIAAGAFEDVNVGCVANPIAADTLTFAVADIEVPTAMYYPSTAGDYRDLELTIEFDDAVAPADGYVVIYDADTDMAVDSIAAEDWTTTDDSTFTAITNDLYFGMFYVMIDSASWTDESAAPVGVTYAGISDDETWTIDINDPQFEDNCYTIITPLDGTTGVETTVDLVVEFCERIKAGEGNLYVADLSSEIGDFVYPIVDSLISEDMMTLTVPVSGLAEMTTYTVTIEPGAILDEAGNEFRGIVDGDIWNFTTGDATAPVVSVVEATVNNLDGEAEITSSEAADVYLVHVDVAADEAAIMAAVDADQAVAGVVSVAGGTVTVSTAGLAAGTYRAVAIDAAGNVAESVEQVVVEDIPTVTIAEIQGDGDASPLVDQVVTTVGVVTGKSDTGFFIQDANAERSGVWVYAPDVTVTVGSGVQITGTVAEYFDLTEIEDVINVQFVAPVIDVVPMVIGADEVGEDYEGVLVTVNMLKTIAVADEFGEWLTTDSEAANVDDATDGTEVKIDEALFEFDPDLGQRYNITGVVNYSFDEYKLAPRGTFDIEVVVDAFEALEAAIEIYPNPFKEFVHLSVPGEVQITKAVITNIAGQIVKETIYPEATIDTKDVRGGVYFISLHTEEGVVKTQRIIKR